jgi:DHA1 family multidrug resistance protein-like MFS transporter
MDYRRNLFAVTAASFIGFMGFTLVMPFLPLYLHQLGVTDVGEVAMWSGLCLGVTPALTALLAPFWGRLADRFGRKIMVERSLISFVFVMTAMAFVTRAWHVLALRALQGLFAGYGALTLTMAADSAPSGRMAQAIGTVQTAQRLGPAVGPVFGGAVAAFVGLRHAFQCAALCYVAAVVLVFVLYHEPGRHAHETGDGDTTAAVTFRSVLAFENFLLMMAVIFGLQFVDRSFGPVLPLYVGQLGVTTQRIPLISGMLFSIAAGAGAVGHHYCATLMRRRSANVVIRLACAVAAAGATVIVIARDARWLFAGAPLFGVAIGAGMTAAYTAAGTVIPAGARGVGFGLLTTSSLIGLALSPIVSGFLGATSIRTVFALDVVALGALAIVIPHVGADRGRRPSPPVSELPQITDEPLLGDTA